MSSLNILGPSHIFIVCLSILSIIYLPKYFEKSSINAKKIFSTTIIILLLINQAMDFYREGIISGRWQDGLPLHLCDFSTMAIILYFLTQKRDFFIFAFFFGNLADMDFFVNFTLDDEFNETIKSRYRDEFNYHSFSEGEKLRIDLAILFTWREIAKMKNSMNTNLLILDEIFDSSLDASGTDEFMRQPHYHWLKPKLRLPIRLFCRLIAHRIGRKP